MNRDEARQVVRDGNPPHGRRAIELLRAHGTILNSGTIGAGDSAKLIEIAAAVSTLCFVAAQELETRWGPDGPPTPGQTHDPRSGQPILRNVRP
jgi:hypothetical protein